jgi:hypothetical protein
VAAAALADAVADLRELDPNHVGEVVVAPSGPFLFVDAAKVAERLVRTIPDIVARRLAEAGVSDAVVAPADREGPLIQLSLVPRAVVLRLYPPPPVERHTDAEMPLPWLDEAWSWVSEGLDADSDVMAKISLVEFRLAAAEAPAFLYQSHRARAQSAMVVSGDLEGHLRGASAFLCYDEPNLILAGGGPAATDDDMVALVERFQEVARRLAPSLAYAFVSIAPTFGTLAFPSQSTDWSRQGGVKSSPLVDQLCDEIVLDAFPYQVLGPGHVARLGGVPPGASSLAGGRVELAVGDPASWLFDPSADTYGRRDLSALRRDPQVQHQARRLLSPCLVRMEEFWDLYRSRIAHNDDLDA